MHPAIHRVNPPQLHRPPGYSHVTVVPAGRLAFLAGQCPVDAEGNVVPAGSAGTGALLPQVDQVVANSLVALSAAGAVPQSVVKAVIYVVSAQRSELVAVWDRFNQSPLGPAFTAASTLLGVCALGFAGQLVELDLIAALP